MKFIIVSGGVLSGLGKGITASSLGVLLKSYNLKVVAVKCDMYLNIDAGTMNPIEHGEVFVTHDGVETDQDLGHYERYLDVNHTRVNYMTNGLIYKTILDKERSLEYNGVCVEPYDQIPPEIIRRWKEAGNFHKADIVLIEFGGTVGEYEGLLFFEAARRLKLKNPHDVLFAHVGYLPTPVSIGEMKSKPLQQSISLLNTLGIQPDIVIGRAEKPIDQKRREKIALASGLLEEDIFSAPDVKSVYEVPLVFEEQKLGERVLEKLGLTKTGNDLSEWTALVSTIKNIKKEVSVAIVGKYQKTGDYMLEDSYVCVLEALKHAGYKWNVKPELVWINSDGFEKLSDSEIAEKLKDVSGIVVPQGWGSRGTEGKIRAAQYARENKIPYLGLCFGMQMASIEFGRNVIGLEDANSAEVNAETSHPVIHIMPHQKELLEKKQYGGTIRLGAWPCVVKTGTRLAQAYELYGEGANAPWNQPNPVIPSQEQIAEGGKLIYERHRHRYEFNNEYRKQYEAQGFIFSGTSPDGELVEAIELKNHPFFVGTQFHPEYESRPLRPHPVFVSFLKALL